MKRKLLFIIATVFLVAACHNDDYMPGLPAPGNEDNETEWPSRLQAGLHWATSLIMAHPYPMPNT